MTVLKHRIASFTPERFERVLGAVRRASVLLTGDDATDLATLADQLEATPERPAAAPVEITITTHARGSA